MCQKDRQTDHWMDGQSMWGVELRVEHLTKNIEAIRNDFFSNPHERCCSQ